MPTVAEIKREIYEKIDLLPLDALQDTDNEIRKRIKEKFSLPVNNDVWIIQSLFGIKVDEYFLTPLFIESLFENADFEFYENNSKTYLFSQKNELLEHDFGTLTSISALDAFRKYGLKNLEKSKEKVYIKVK